MLYAFRHIHKVTLIQTCLSTLVHISEDSDIFRILVLPVRETSTCSSSQIFLVFPCSNLFGSFFHFCFKSNQSTFFRKDSLSIPAIAIIISCNMSLLITHTTLTTLTTHLAHTTLVSMSPTPMSTTQPTLSRYPHHPRNPRLHITHTSCYPRRYAIYATYAHMIPMPLTVARIECHFSNSTMKVMIQVVKFLLKVHTVFIQLL